MDFINWDELDEEIEEVIKETIELYPNGDSFLSISPRSGLVESTDGPRHNVPISVPLGMVLRENSETGQIEIDYATIHKMIRRLDMEDDCDPYLFPI